MLSNLMTNAALTNEVRGRIVNIKLGTPSIDALGATVPQYNLAMQANGSIFNIIIDANKFADQILSHFNFSEKKIQEARAGTFNLSKEDQNVIYNSKLDLTINLSKATPAATLGAQAGTSFTSQADSAKATVANPIQQDIEHSTPVPEEWPNPETVLPFTPIAVPVPKDKAFTRIGYAVFDNPIHYITQSRTTQIEQIPTLRLPGTIKKGTGKAYESYTISYMANGADEIDKSVREVFEQISLNPFTSVEGGPFGDKGQENGDIKYQAIAVRNFSVTTVDGFPNSLQVEISFDPFNWQYYMPMSENEISPISCYDDVICWPLVKVWSSLANKSTFSGGEFNGALGLYFPNIEGTKLIEEIYSNRRKIDPADDYSAIASFVSRLDSPGGGSITSRNFKEIIGPENIEARVFVLKVASKALYDQFVNDNEHFVGLLNWSKLSASNFYNHKGNFLSSSADITPDYFTKIVSGKAFKGDEVYSDGNRQSYLNHFVDIPRDDSGRNDLQSRINTYLTNNNGTDLIADAASNPQRTFAVVLYVTPSNRKELETKLVRLQAEADKIDNYKIINRTKESKEAIFRGGQFNNPTYDRTFSIEAGPGGTDSDILIERIGGSRGHNLALLSQRGDPLPIHQYMGGMDATFIIQGKCFGHEAKTKLEQLKDKFDREALYKKSSKFNIDIDQATKSNGVTASFLYVDNEIFSLLGVNFIMPVTLQFETVDQEPDCWNFTLSVIEYNPDLKRGEEVKFLPTSWQQLGRISNYGWDSDIYSNNPTVDRAIEYFNLQAQLAQEEVYPDMNLPTKGEIDYWIYSIKKGAEQWTKKPGLSNLYQTMTGKGYKYSQYTIAQIVAQQFYPTSAQQIADNWAKDARGKSTEDTLIKPSGVESSAFAEPDFFAWYHPDDSFGNIFDDLSKHQMGVGPQKNVDGSPQNLEPNKFNAQGRPTGDRDSSKLPSGPYREYNPNDGLTAIFETEHYAGNASKFSIEGQTQKILKSGLYPKERANVVKKAVAESDHSIDQANGAWWTILEQNYLAAKYSNDTNIPIYSDPAQDASMVGVDVVKSEGAKANTIPTKIDAPNAYGDANEIAPYYTIDWRQNEIKTACSFLNTYNLTVQDLESFNTDNFFFASNSEELLDSGSVLTNAFRILKRGILAENQADPENPLTMPKIEDGIKTSIKYYMLQNDEDRKAMAERLQDENGYGFVPGPMLLPTTAPWIVRSALISANFRRIQSDPNSVSIPSFNSNGREGIIETWNYIDALGAKYNIDPHILRSVFVRRTNFGQFDRIASQEEGFGDFNLPNNPKEALEIFALQYSIFAKELYNVPSIVLLATNIQFTNNGAPLRALDDQNKSNIKKEVWEQLRSAAAAVATNRRSTTAIQAIKSILNRYPEVGKIVDDYYASYLVLCRNYGSYEGAGLDDWRDSYFHGRNLYNVIDTDTNRETMILNFTPTHGGGVAIKLSRGDISSAFMDPILGNRSKEQIENSSADLDAALATKMRASLDPHSETALYGSLIDFRTNAPIGKLRGAFPSFQILLINEGFYWNGGTKKLWDQFYTRTAVASIEVHRSRHLPGSTASVTFSNMFHNITAYALMEALAHKAAVENHETLGRVVKGLNFNEMISSIWDLMVVKNVPEDARKIWQNNQLKRLALTVGTRLQIRMGYGSNAANLPVVFTGNVLDAPVTDGYVTLTAVSDGHELERTTNTKLVKSSGAYAFQDSGPIGTGIDPTSIIKAGIISASTWDNLTGGNFRDQSNTIAHFGDIQYHGFLRNSAELEINMYEAKRTTIESGISEIERYNLVNGIVNWNNERNLFSVSVQEPTPWKIMEVCRRACSDFVAAAEPFALRSTIFFGKWWWPYHFTYDESILKLMPGGGAGFIQGKAAAIKQVVSRPADFSPDGTKSSVADTKQQITKDTYLIKDVPDNLVQTAKNAYTYSVPGYAKALPNNSWMFYFQDGGTVLLVDGLVNMTEIGSTEGRARYQKAIGGIGIMDKGYGTDTVIAEPHTALEEKVVEVARNAAQDGLKEVTNLQLHLRWKPYMQAYIAHSGINLLDNNIRADGSKVYTDAVGMHQYNGWLSGDSVSKTIAFSVDTDIHPADRKTMMVDTGILLTALQSGWDGIGAGVTSLPAKIPFLGEMFAPIHNYIAESPTTPAIENAVIAALIDQVKEMYQGWFTITGIGSVKPRDLFYLTDHVTDLKGPVFVKDVIHRMDAQTGFITMVSPDAVVLPHDSVIGQQMILGLSTGFLFRLGGFLITKAAAVGLMQTIKNKYFYTGINQALSSDYRKYQRIKKNVAAVEGEIAGLKDKVNKSLTKKLDRVTKYLKEAKIDPNIGAKYGFTSIADAVTSQTETLRNLQTLKGLKEGDYSELFKLAKELAIVKDGDAITKKLAVANSLFDKIVKFEADLEQEVENFNKSRNLLGKWSQAEFDTAIQHFKNERYAAFISANAEEAAAFLDVIPTTAEATTAIKNLEEAKSAYNLASLNKKLTSVEKENLAEAERAVQKLANVGDIIESDIADIELRSMIKFDQVIFAEGKRVNELRAAYNAVVGTPRTILEGGAALADGIVTEVVEGFAKRKASAEVLKLGWKSWLLPSPATNMLIKLKNMETEVTGDVEKYKKALEDRLKISDALVGAEREAAEAARLAEIAKLVETRTSRLKVVRRLAFLEEIKTAITSGVNGVRLLKYMGPQAVLSLAVDAVVLTLGQSIVEGHNARLRARQCVKIIPLRAGHLPYTAGIKGHQGAVIGDNPSWTDELISGLHGAGNALNPTTLAIFGVFAAMGGVTVPQYGMTEVDSAYLNGIRETEQDSVETNEGKQ